MNYAKINEVVSLYGLVGWVRVRRSKRANTEEWGGVSSGW